MKGLSSAVLALAMLLGGCTGSVQYVPNLVAIVRDVDHGGQDTRYTLADGRQFWFLRNGNFIGGSEPQIDTILIAGSQPVPWVAWAAIRDPDATTPEGCYAIYGRATASATHVFLTVRDTSGEVLMVFPKSADWVDHGYEQGSDQLMGPYTCLNPRGEAFERGL